MRNHQKMLWCCALSGFAAMAQRPTIQPEVVVNAASYAGSATITSGAIFSIFGQNLAPAARQAGDVPLPRAMEGTSVLVNGIAAPLFYVSPRQINFQVSSHYTSPDGQPIYEISVVVNTPAGSSEPVLLKPLSNQFGIFTQGAAGCGQAAALNLSLDGTSTVNSPTQSASPGSYVAVYATGLGYVYFAPNDGEPAGWDPLSRSPSGPGVRLGLPGFKSASPMVNYAGRAPGFVGVDQINILIPDDAPEGCEVPLTLFGASSTSQPAILAIRRGGGPCQNPPRARVASLQWQRTVASLPGLPGPTTEETFSGTIVEAAQNQLAPTPARSEQVCGCGGGSPGADRVAPMLDRIPSVPAS